MRGALDDGLFKRDLLVIRDYYFVVFVYCDDCGAVLVRKVVLCHCHHLYIGCGYMAALRAANNFVILLLS